jgi:pyridoxal 5'-phosphate synthase pdxT subunit
VQIGVLALQGDFAQHKKMLKSLDVDVKLIRYPDDLKNCQGLIIPGGESTTIFQQMEFIGLDKSIIEFAKTKPVFGTCAGMILISNFVDDKQNNTLRLIDISVSRNAWGRQVFSFTQNISLNFDDSEEHKAFFIRAPRVTQISNNIKILAQINKEPVLLTDGKHLVCSFHPELGADNRIHKYFLRMVNDRI